jgi:hypothetical protein
MLFIRYDESLLQKNRLMRQFYRFSPGGEVSSSIYHGAKRKMFRYRYAFLIITLLNLRHAFFYTKLVMEGDLCLGLCPICKKCIYIH